MPQNAAHAFCVPCRHSWQHRYGPAFLAVPVRSGCARQAGTHPSKSPAQVPARQAETLRHALRVTRRLRRQLSGVRV